jgi:CheY-like chemotaxis protein
MRILLIDDDEDDQILFCEAVSAIAPDVRCGVANNGEEGLFLLNSYPILPQIVFLDINMPIMDGIQTLRAIRSSVMLKELEVIVYSTSNYQEEIERIKAFGAGFITKPSDFEKLKQVLREPIARAIATRKQLMVTV